MGTAASWGGGVGFSNSGMRNLDRCDVIIRNDHAHPDFREWEKPLSEAVRQADASVRRRIARKCARMERNARPRNSLHERHRSVIVDVRKVFLFFFENAVNADRRLVIRSAARDVRAHRAAGGIVDRYTLVPDGHDRHDGLAGQCILLRVFELAGAAFPGLSRVEGHDRGQCNQRDHREVLSL